MSRAFFRVMFRAKSHAVFYARLAALCAPLFAEKAK
jgi:hypothetical protein